nr:hypothetical protein [Tanacetum cinerariifolium]
MHGSEITEQERHSRLMNEFDKFVVMEGESLTYVYEMITTLVNVMDQHKDGRVDIKNKNVSYARNDNRNAGRQNRNQAANTKNGLVQQVDENDQNVQWVPRTESNPGKANVQCYNCNAKGHYARNCPKPKVRDAKYFTEQMLLAMKDEAGGNLNEEENDFMLNHAYGDDTLEELCAAVNMMTRIQPTDDDADGEPKYDAEVISKVNASQINLISGMLFKGVHEHTNHEKLKTIINTSDDDQIDSNIIFDDPYMKNNGGTDEHDSNAHDQTFDIESLIYNVQKEVENQQRMNNELKRKKALLQKELVTCKELKNVNTKFDKSETLEKVICVTLLNKNKDLKAKIVSKVEVKTDKSKPVTSCSTPKNEQSQKTNANVMARGMYRVTKIEMKMTAAKTNKFSCNSTGVVSFSSVRRLESKDTNIKKRVLLNTKSKSTSKEDKKSHSSINFVSNKNDTMNSNVSESKANVLKAKTINDVHDGSNIVCVSCGKDVFLIAHDKCVGRYALSSNSRVKIALFTYHVAAKSSKIGATPVVVKSRFNVVTPLKAANKVCRASSLTSESRQSSNYEVHCEDKLKGTHFGA